MWKRIETNEGGPKLVPTQEIEGITPDKLSFFVLPRSGNGDMYIFQGMFPLNQEEKDIYNLVLTSLFPLWHVQRLKDLRGFPSRAIQQSGRTLARSLVQTLPEITDMGGRHNLSWLIRAWINPETLSFQEYLQKHNGITL
jgi:hypothetical protein